MTHDERSLTRTRSESSAEDRSGRSSRRRILLVRLLVLLTLTAGLIYIVWRWGFSLNLDAWWLSIPLVVAETYMLIDVALFGLTVWRARDRPPPPAPPEGATVDVFITTYNEPEELVRATAIAALAIRYPHETYILDDGARPSVRALAEEIGVGYVTRSADWTGKSRHAKAGNLNNALMETSGEFLLVLDADQVPSPEVLDRTLGYFTDPEVALVQTPQVFSNVAAGDPLGSRAPLFYGPIQQGKDGWNAAFFCGSNAVLRREALMQLGIVRYVVEVEKAVREAISGAMRVVARARRSRRSRDPMVQDALEEIFEALQRTRTEVKGGAALAQATFALQEKVRAASRRLVDQDMRLIADDLAAIAALDESAGIDPGAPTVEAPADGMRTLLLAGIEQNAEMLASRDLSPLGALAAVERLLRQIDVDRADEAQPLMPLATVSVTEDMATSMRLHGLGWRSVYHHETLVHGLAPEDLGTALRQRLRWAQGTVQVMLRESPWTQRGLTLGQRLMYSATMWSYLSGYATVVFIAAPAIFLIFGILPVSSTAFEFFLRFLPFLVLSQLMFLVVGRGMSTWRGQQYSLALFPVWIAACWTAFMNVVFRRPLDFVVTSKVRERLPNPLRIVRWQIVASAVLLVATVVGVARLVMGIGEPLGTAVNVGWVAFDLVMFSVLVSAVRFRGYESEPEPTPEPALEKEHLP